MSALPPIQADLLERSLRMPSMIQLKSGDYCF